MHQTKPEHYEIEVYKPDFEKFRQWIKEGRGVVVWENHAIGDFRLGHRMYTPKTTTDGREYDAPYDDKSPMVALHGFSWQYVKIRTFKTLEAFDAHCIWKEPDEPDSTS